jgi:hypothetical protein
MRIPDELLDCVCFLFVKDSRTGYEVDKYAGTAFFVQYPSEKSGNYIYLVTARHCIEKARQMFGNLYLRVNAKAGGTKSYKVEAEWFYPEDAAVDVAILPWAPATAEIQYTTIPKFMFLTDETIEQHGIGIGDELTVLGLFTQRFGNQRNLPIARTGIIAAMPNEPLEDPATGGPYDAYLAEVRSIGGLSGSPVFVILEPGRTHKGTISLARTGYLLGLIRGHWDYKKQLLPLDFSEDEIEQINMGIAVVTPIKEALKIIEGEHFMKDRRRQDREIAKKSAPSQDTTASGEDSEGVQSRGIS